MTERIIDENLKLIPYYRNDEVSLAWYQDPELVKQVDNKDSVYDPEQLHRMYDFLSSHGDCFYIEYCGDLVGDVTLRDDSEIAIVISREYQNRHIGRKCIGEMLKLAREKGMERVKANIYSFNEQSKKMFMAAGFVQTDDEWYEYPIEHEIEIEEIPVDDVSEFWDIHIRYLIDDGIIDDEDVEYFSGSEYRGILEEHMRRNTDKHHMVYFLRGGERIGAASYCTYQSEDGKCYLMDFWVFPEFRGNGTGHRCFEALEKYTKADGASYYEINSEKDDSVRFWKSLGFVENGTDEWDMPLYIKK